MKHNFLLIICSLALSATGQGPFPPAAGQAGSTAIHQDSSVFVAWATGCSVSRGPEDIAVLSSPLASAGAPSMAIGSAGSNGVVSLGDGGTAILTFDHPIVDGPGYDFAVFENSFSDTFLELAFVEVSSDGVNYVRFSATSMTSTQAQVGTFGAVDPTQIHNLAGKYRAQYGTPFDLDELAGTPGLDIQSITHVRIQDVVGSIQAPYASVDAFGTVINDPYPTAFSSGGFDLDAVGVIHTNVLKIPDQQALEYTIYPNPCRDRLTVTLDYADHYNIALFSLTGHQVLEQSVVGTTTTLESVNISPGIYYLQIQANGHTYTEKVVFQ